MLEILPTPIERLMTGVVVVVGIELSVVEEPPTATETLMMGLLVLLGVDSVVVGFDKVEEDFIVVIDVVVVSLTMTVTLPPRIVVEDVWTPTETPTLKDELPPLAPALRHTLSVHVVVADV